MRTTSAFTIVFSAGLLAVSACGRSPAREPAPGPQAKAPAAASPEAPAPSTAGVSGQLPGAVSDVLFQKWTGDLDGMIQRRMVRAGVVFNRTHYFIDRGVQRGTAYESLKLFEDDLNARRKPSERVQVVFVPLSRDALLPALINGEVDLVAAMLTVTPEREKVVDFSPPTRTDINDIVVTGPGGPPMTTIEGLSGQKVFVRKTSSYYTNLVALNARFKSEGRPEVQLQLAPENFEDDDLLEMTNAGLVKTVIVHDYLAQFWSQVFPNLRLHPDARLATGGRLAVAIRKNSPQLMAAATAWVKKYGPRTMFGNMVTQRYLQSTKFVTDATSAAARRRFESMARLFRKYGDKYDVDYLLMMAQAYQESQLNHEARSAAGAIGVMQLLPATGKEMDVGDVRELEPNIHAGVKYLRFMVDKYYRDEPMTRLNKGLFTFASYNAGPGRIHQMREIARKRGLDPNVWFDNVERVASEQIGRETVQYVSNIFKYYVAYRLVTAAEEAKR